MSSYSILVVQRTTIGRNRYRSSLAPIQPMKRFSTIQLTSEESVILTANIIPKTSNGKKN